MLDPMVGRAGLLTEVAQTFPMAYYSGVDMDKDQLAAGRDNLASAKLPQIELVLGDARHLPFPFGKRHARGNKRELYPPVVAECERVVRGDGVAVVTTHKALVHDIVIQDGEWIPGCLRQVSLGGLMAFMHAPKKCL